MKSARPVLFALLLSSAASAQQLSHAVERSPAEWTFHTRWKDAEGQRHAVDYGLPGAGVRADLREPTVLDLEAVAQDVAVAVRTAAADMPGIEATVAVSGGDIRIDARGRTRDQVQAALDALAVVRDAAWDRELAARDHFKLTDTGVTADHARLAARYADGLRPLVDALGGPGSSPRAFADRALGFVQSIPYDQGLRRNGGYRRPMSVLGRNQGDCDSKTVLFLALMRSAWPDVDAAIVYVPDHAFALLDIPREKGDETVKFDGGKWVAVEPVGPALRPVGALGDKSAAGRKRWEEVRVVPR
ncbi:MAG: transglutaminase domain-containing protein [Alphaproteobacteria bacterium]|nr:transglutaminase domain-containing protein [Alphaproteobacteria bacterium]